MTLAGWLPKRSTSELAVRTNRGWKKRKKALLTRQENVPSTAEEINLELLGSNHRLHNSRLECQVHGMTRSTLGRHRIHLTETDPGHRKRMTVVNSSHHELKKTRESTAEITARRGVYSKGEGAVAPTAIRYTEK